MVRAGKCMRNNSAEEGAVIIKDTNYLLQGLGRQVRPYNELSSGVDFFVAKKLCVGCFG